MRVVDELKAKKSELAERIATLQAEIGSLGHQKATFGTIVIVDDQAYVSEDVKSRAQKPSKVSAAPSHLCLKAWTSEEHC